MKGKSHFQLLSSFEHTHTVTHTLSTKLSHKHHRNTPGHNTAQNRTHQFTRPNVSTTTATQMMHEANQFMSPSEPTPSELPPPAPSLPEYPFFSSDLPPALDPACPPTEAGVLTNNHAQRSQISRRRTRSSCYRLSHGELRLCYRLSYGELWLGYGQRADLRLRMSAPWAARTRAFPLNVGDERFNVIFEVRASKVTG